MIIDIVDQIGSFPRGASTRKIFYKTSGYDIDTYKVDCGQILKQTRSEKAPKINNSSESNRKGILKVIDASDTDTCSEDEILVKGSVDDSGRKRTKKIAIQIDSDSEDNELDLINLVRSSKKVNK